MYSRKFGPRLRGKVQKFLGPIDYADDTERVICRTRMRSGFYENERSFRLAAESCALAACAPQTRTLLGRE
jgi:hypothetical protein